MHVTKQHLWLAWLDSTCNQTTTSCMHTAWLLGPGSPRRARLTGEDNQSRPTHATNQKLQLAWLYEYSNQTKAPCIWQTWPARACTSDASQAPPVLKPIRPDDATRAHAMLSMVRWSPSNPCMHALVVLAKDACRSRGLPRQDLV